MSAITVFNAECPLISYRDTKGRELRISAEGAIVKGGKTLMSLMKDAACESAFRKAESGKYRSAADILTVAFPSVGKAAEKLLGNVWANKSAMGTLIAAVLRVESNDKGYNDKQLRARALAYELLTLKAFADIAEQTSETVDA